MYSVIITDKYISDDEDFYNQLIFNFDDKKEAILFTAKILQITEDYSVEIVSKVKGE